MEQISYCKRLIESSEFHLSQSSKSDDTHHFQRLMEAAHIELKLLQAKRHG
ncbi:hypothetical protein [Flagellimonas okinawensis]|uniref:Uncharacterized protein n=1 Tax=Flagellimonas okinawensis TaxID=3031324 RepID=A0ABT5XR25_9FLAO|nr:hypothetical protein [[Muricauda] okinawensis]MDF0708349.1 hypothetical protein [[Muricauda] okinawensis]